MTEYNHQIDWFYEGSISKNLVSYLILNGYTILKDNSENLKARGEDIIAVSPNGIKEVIEVKGYPTAFYVGGKNKGEVKRTIPKLQAKHWFSEAILSSLFNYSKHKGSDDFLIALAFPLMSRYSELVKKVEDYFTDHKINFKVYFVDSQGNVSIDNLSISERQSTNQ